jgi:DedD protein
LHDLSDRALKERVIGAAVLVIFAVLVVPIFLDGPSTESEIVSESVTLPGQNDGERKQQTIVLDRNRNQPVPTTQASVPRTAEPEPKAEPPAQQTASRPPPAAASTPEPEPESTAAPATSSDTGMWAVQLGSFADKDNAERLAADLRDKGYAAFLSQLQTDGGALQRVRVGPQKDRESAEQIAAQLAKTGLSSQVVPHP